jgi:hypothetical protein
MSSHAIKFYCEGGLGVTIQLLHTGPCDQRDSNGDCLLADWVENVGNDLLQGEITVPVRVEWLEEDSPVLHLEPGSGGVGGGAGGEVQISLDPVRVTAEALRRTLPNALASQPPASTEGGAVMGGEKITLELGQATKEQLEEALENARDFERRCNEQGSWWHTWTTRREALESALSARRFTQPNNEQCYREALADLLDAWLNCENRTLGEGDWEAMDEAERNARAALEGDSP